jgi:hypothetical protein
MRKTKPTIGQLLEKYDLELIAAEPCHRSIRNQYTDMIRSIVAVCQVQDNQGEERSVMLLDDGRVLRSLVVCEEI